MRKLNRAALVALIVVGGSVFAFRTKESKPVTDQSCGCPVYDISGTLVATKQPGSVHQFDEGWYKCVKDTVCECNWKFCSVESNSPCATINSNASCN
jgi:hypothetical protein